MILIINAGSSSLKFALYHLKGLKCLVRGMVESIGLDSSQVTAKMGSRSYILQQRVENHQDAYQAMLAVFTSFDIHPQSVRAVGHRVVHGGQAFQKPEFITRSSMDKLHAIASLAPLHNPCNIQGIECALSVFSCPQIAIFDTAFHSHMPPKAYLYGLPYHWYQQYGFRRYGFHGSSHQYLAQRIVDMASLSPQDHGLIIAHLGNGCSLSAVHNGRSVDTTMGYTPLEGLVMGTRCGNIDIGMLPSMMQASGLDIQGILRTLNESSGLLGLSTISSDMRQIEAAAQQGNENAQRALDVFCYQISKQVAAMMVALPRVDALVFSGGIGQHSAVVRHQIVEALSVLGFAIDEQANTNPKGNIAHHRSQVGIWVLPTDEEYLMATETSAMLNDRQGGDHHG